MSNKVGLKFDQGKAELDLIPFSSLKEIAKVLTYGKEKYGKNNWKNGLAMSRLLAATMRHLGDFAEGIDKDEESGLSHLAHAGANVVFMLWMLKNKPEYDDREQE